MAEEEEEEEEGENKLVRPLAVKNVLGHLLGPSVHKSV